MAFHSEGPVLVESISNVTATRGARDPELGTRVIKNDKTYLYVYNAGNSQVPPSYGVVQAGGSGTSGYSVTISSVTGADFLLGVVEHATLTTGTYGWIVQKGLVDVEMEADNSCVTGQILAVAANGEFALKSNSTGYAAPAVGKAMESAASGASALAYISVY